MVFYVTQNKKKEKKVFSFNVMVRYYHKSSRIFTKHITHNFNVLSQVYEYIYLEIILSSYIITLKCLVSFIILLCVFFTKSFEQLITRTPL